MNNNLQLIEAFDRVDIGFLYNILILTNYILLENHRCFSGTTKLSTASVLSKKIDTFKCFRIETVSSYLRDDIILDRSRVCLCGVVFSYWRLSPWAAAARRRRRRGCRAGRSASAAWTRSRTGTWRDTPRCIAQSPFHTGRSRHLWDYLILRCNPETKIS